jgi:myo-inositol-1(or 4)-monophosphatase
LATAREAAEAAADVHGRYVGRVGIDGAIEKGRSDFVSEVDLESQRAALAVIRARYPGHLIMAEEEDAPAPAPDEDRPLWVVDPLDGTTNFLHGHPAYAASIAVAIEGRVVAGAVTAQATGLRWWACEGGGAWLDGPTTSGPKRLSVSSTGKLRASLIGTGFPFKRLDALPRYLDQFGRVLRETAGIRRCGAAALDLCYLASGSLDAFWELFLNPWDFAAGLVILSEAGGLAERMDGSLVDLAPGSVVAANSRALLVALRETIDPTVDGALGER